MLQKNDLVQLMKAAASADRSNPVAYSYNGQNFSYDALNETLRQELNEYAGTYAQFRENKNLIFSVIEETIDEILPKKVQLAYEKFAEVRNFGNNETVQFRRKIAASRARAKQFVTRVGLAGIYEVFKLGKTEEVFGVKTSAIGGAASIGFEEFLDGRADFAEVTAIIMEGMDELIYREIGEALKAAIGQLPPANRVAAAGFDEAAFDTLLQVASAYGNPVIYCTHEFAVKMIPQESWRYTESMKEELNRTGRLANYKGTQVVILPQAFADETNSKKILDPGYAYIIPTGADTRPVKVAFQGGTLVNERENNADWSREIHVYKKVGVVCMMANNICAYKDTTLAGNLDTWNFKDTVKNVVHVVTE